VFADSSPITFTSPPSKVYQKSGPFAPPALPSFDAHTTLSVSRLGQSRNYLDGFQRSEIIPHRTLSRLLGAAPTRSRSLAGPIFSGCRVVRLMIDILEPKEGETIIPSGSERGSGS